MLNRASGEINVMAPGDGTVLEYVVLNKAFKLGDLEDLISLSSHNEFFFSPVDGEVTNISKEFGVIEIRVNNEVDILVSTHINKNIKSVEPMIDIGGNVLTGQPLMYFEKEDDYDLPITVAIKKSDSILRLIKSKNKDILVDEFVMKLNLS
ncbi:hypothetical protein [Clostridium sp. LIBA-8841]|uniref:hypothetical protein n=1 Tax=Clostridium sp. LIBA-8841 TaxID=2987530 RepID=UPI002AC5416B|nr:hypothetical protein [Clostridium sp. LIBA-8841]MDZ5254268.1 hypothetical protein [Clostridium sp. LIBA-8841]